MKKSAILLLGACLLFLWGCNSSKISVDNSTVSAIDLQRFLGKWYEIARFDHSFERSMTHCKVHYSLQADNSIRVRNQGLKNGKWKESIGKAKTTSQPGLLRVSFWRPFYSDCRVMMLAGDYSYALIGSGDDDYLWILSRTPHLPKPVIDRILNEAERRGYDTDELIWVQQDTEVSSME